MTTTNTTAVQDASLTPRVNTTAIDHPFHADLYEDEYTDDLIEGTKPRIVLKDSLGREHTFTHDNMQSLAKSLGWSLEEYAYQMIDDINESITNH